MPSWRRLIAASIFWLLQTGAASLGFFRTFMDYGLIKDRSIALKLGLSVAKLGGYLSNLNIALLLLSMSRATITKLSMTRWGKLLGLDLLIPLHRWSGYLFVFGGICHVTAHIYNLVQFGKISAVNWRHPTLVLGYVLVSLSFLIAITAYSEQIRRRCFELFRFTHYLWLPLIITFIMHGLFCFLKGENRQCVGSTTVYWIIVPFLFQITDMIYMQVRASKFAYISKVIEHPSKVFEVQIRRPNFFFLAGQYIYLNIPNISRLEWHPFTLTSAPEEDHLSIHIRVAGNWTRALQSYLSTVRLEEVKIGVDGPYGCASQGYEMYSSIICIGAGIGQTPFASILKSLWFRLNKPLTQLHFKTIQFIGICRNPKSFEWFNDILAALERSDEHGILRFHLYVTGPLNENERSMVTAYHGLLRSDPLTGLRSSTKFGRPNLRNLFEDWARLMESERIGVFYCGPSQFGDQVRAICSLYSSSVTRFAFHQESF